MEIQIFGKQSCVKCRTSKNKIAHLLGEWQMQDTVPVKYFDLETADGMAEGAFYDVLHIPTIVVRNDDGEVVRWSGVVPQEDDIKKAISP